MTLAYFDREGCPISPQQWSALFEDPDYPPVAETIITVGPDVPQYTVSTRWVGHCVLGAVAPTYERHVFETLVSRTDGDFFPCAHEVHATVTDALFGHAAQVVVFAAQIVAHPVTARTGSDGRMPADTADDEGAGQ